MKVLQKIFFLFSYFLILRTFLRLIYFRVLHHICDQYRDREDLVDIVLMSDIKSKDFIFGRNQFTLLLITPNETHPKNVLNEFRQYLKKSLLSKTVMNLSYIPILTEREFKIDVLKGFLIRNSERDTVRWKSMLKGKDYIFYLGKQNKFAIDHTSFQNLSHFFLTQNDEVTTRILVKNTRRAMRNFQKFHPEFIELHPDFEKISVRLIKFPLLKPLYFKKFFKLTWDILLKHKISTETASYNLTEEQKEQIKPLKSLLKNPTINDVFITPSKIQDSPDEFRGKLYLDIILRHPLSLTDQESIKQQIEARNTKRLKFRVRYTSAALFHLSSHVSLYPFPLEPLLRKYTGFSLGERKYNFMPDYESLIMASIHFLSMQFMRFRSLEQKSDLIGSKFIKSLNIMYRYHLLLDFLTGEEFSLESSPEEIRSYFTPQFSHLNLYDPVSENDWIVIEAQMKYLLKKIRTELSRYDDSLTLLRF